MDFRFTTEQEAFHQEIRAFVRAALPEPPDILEDAWIVGFDRAFSKKLAAHGWIGLTWPRAYSVELMHMIKKRQLMVEAGDEGRTAAEQFYALAA